MDPEITKWLMTALSGISIAVAGYCVKKVVEELPKLASKDTVAAQEARIAKVEASAATNAALLHEVISLAAKVGALESTVSHHAELDDLRFGQLDKEANGIGKTLAAILDKRSGGSSGGSGENSSRRG